MYLNRYALFFMQGLLNFIHGAAEAFAEGFTWMTRGFCLYIGFTLAEWWMK